MENLEAETELIGRLKEELGLQQERVRNLEQDNECLRQMEDNQHQHVKLLGRKINALRDVLQFYAEGHRDKGIKAGEGLLI